MPLIVGTHFYFYFLRVDCIGKAPIIVKMWMFINIAISLSFNKHSVFVQYVRRDSNK